MADSTAERPSIDVLVLDDDVSIRDTTVEILRHAGLTVVPAHTVDTALELCERFDFAAVVLDHTLNEPDGEDLLRRSAWPIPTVIVSASPLYHLEDIQQRFPDRVVGVRNKPCDPPDLVAVVKEAVERSGRQRA
jgi:DNA-binding NtrC family response regulator